MAAKRSRSQASNHTGNRMAAGRAGTWAAESDPARRQRCAVLKNTQLRERFAAYERSWQKVFYLSGWASIRSTVYRTETFVHKSTIQLAANCIKLYLYLRLYGIYFPNNTRIWQFIHSNRSGRKFSIRTSIFQPFCSILLLAKRNGDAGIEQQDFGTEEEIRTLDRELLLRRLLTENRTLK